MIKDNFGCMIHDADIDGIADPRLSKRDVAQTIVDWKTWYVLVFNICASVPNQTFFMFLPLVVQDLENSSMQANIESSYM